MHGKRTETSRKDLNASILHSFLFFQKISYKFYWLRRNSSIALIKKKKKKELPQLHKCIHEVVLKNYKRMTTIEKR